LVSPSKIWDKPFAQKKKKKLKEENNRKDIGENANVHRKVG